MGFTEKPTAIPTNIPTNTPTNVPAIIPSYLPSNTPSITPTIQPTNIPINIETIATKTTLMSINIINNTKNINTYANNNDQDKSLTIFETIFNDILYTIIICAILFICIFLICLFIGIYIYSNNKKRISNVNILDKKNIGDNINQKVCNLFYFIFLILMYISMVPRDTQNLIKFCKSTC